MNHYERFRRAEGLFADRDYAGAARELEGLLSDLPPGGVGHGIQAVRELLTRSHYHSAQLGRAQAGARELLRDDPTSEYAALLLARSLDRGSSVEEAEYAWRLAGALAGP